MTIADLKQQGLIVYECVSGSQAYGLALPTSDVDIKGVFVLPRDKFYGLDYVAQVSDATNDTVYYELGRYIELLLANNPNMLELLATPAKHVLRKHPALGKLTPKLFLSRECEDTFAGYAATQIRKASGLNKKINQPMDAERKSLLDFCKVLVDGGSRSLTDWLAAQGWRQENLGLVNVAQAKGIYAMYHDATGEFGYQGVLRKRDANQVALSSVPQGEEPVAYLCVNLDGYQAYCKTYRQYWDWVQQRNDARYTETVTHDSGYDAKNMMHTFRLLDMAEEILRTGEIIVERPNREELLAIRRGEYAYEDLLARAEEKLSEVRAAAVGSLLPEVPDKEAVEAVLVSLREEFYGAGF